MKNMKNEEVICDICGNISEFKCFHCGEDLCDACAYTLPNNKYICTDCMDDNERGILKTVSTIRNEEEKKRRGLDVNGTSLLESPPKIRSRCPKNCPVRMYGRDPETKERIFLCMLFDEELDKVPQELFPGLSVIDVTYAAQNCRDQQGNPFGWSCHKNKMREALHPISRFNKLANIRNQYSWCKANPIDTCPGERFDQRKHGQLYDFINVKMCRTCKFFETPKGIRL